MKRSRENSNEELSLSVKRSKQLPSHETLSPYVKKIHTALGGLALSTVQYPNDTSFCLFSIKSPPLVLTMDSIEKIVHIKGIDFVIYKGRSDRTMILQADIDPDDPSEDRFPTISDKVEQEEISETIPMDPSWTDREKRIVLWMHCIQPFKYTIKKTKHGLVFTATSCEEKIKRSFFKEVYQIKSNKWFITYKLLLQEDRLVLLFKF